MNTGDYTRTSRVTTGAMVALATVQNLNREYSLQHGAPFYNVTATARGLAIESVTATDATGSGHVDRTTTTPGGSQTETYDGPFHLRRSGQSWQVVDAIFDHAPLAVADVRKTEEEPPLRVTLVSVLDFGQSTAALFTAELTKSGVSNVKVNGATITRGGASADSVQAILVRTATTGEGYAGFRRSPGAATRVALVFDADGQQARFDFAL